MNYRKTQIYIYYAIDLIVKNKLFQLLIILCINFLVVGNFSSDILYNNDNIYELEGDYNNSNYTPYNPNFVNTNQGYKIELDSIPVYTNNHEEFVRIPNPSHYPHVNSQYPINNIDNVISIEPSRSQIEDQGFYYHTGNKNGIEYSNNYPGFVSKLKSFSGKVKSNVEKWNENLEDFGVHRYKKSGGRQVKRIMDWKAAHNHNVTVKDKYYTMPLSNNEIAKLYNPKYTFKHDKITRINK